MQNIKKNYGKTQYCCNSNCHCSIQTLPPYNIIATDFSDQDVSFKAIPANNIQWHLFIQQNCVRKASDLNKAGTCILPGWHCCLSEKSQPKHQIQMDKAFSPQFLQGKKFGDTILQMAVMTLREGYMG